MQNRLVLRKNSLVTKMRVFCIYFRAFNASATAWMFFGELPI
jgi:hypothetical protein